jgi:hypothetical protein
MSIFHHLKTMSGNFHSFQSTTTRRGRNRRNVGLPPPSGENMLNEITSKKRAWLLPYFVFWKIWQKWNFFVNCEKKLEKIIDLKRVGNKSMAPQVLKMGRACCTGWNKDPFNVPLPLQRFHTYRTYVQKWPIKLSLCSPSAQASVFSK